MTRQLTLGSLFDGIGGFCLAGQYAGIRPVFASEVDPFPIRVTRKRFSDVQQLGDVHALNGASIPPVDIITFGSPCQNLSIAGKRAGLSGEQSSLFFEAIRIITEMRSSTNGQYPRWAVWENVPGALSSNDGQDFRQVLASLIHIKAPQADVPMPANGKWLGAGEILGDHYSVAWRILDAAKGWGVAQRRRRIFAVLDLDGQCAGKVLFESEGLSGYTPPGGEAREGAAGSAPQSAGAAGRYCLNDMGGGRMNVTEDVTHTLRASDHDHPPLIMEDVSSGGFCTEHSADSRGIGFEMEKSPTLRAGVVQGVAIDFNPTASRIRIEEDGICQTLCSRAGTGGNNVPLTMQPVAYGIGSDKSEGMLSDNPRAGFYEAATSRTLDCNCSGPARNQGGIAVVEPVNPAYSMTVGGFMDVNKEVSPTLMARDYKDAPLIGQAPEVEYLVRRLTPDECCRLQAYPDGWCKGLEDPLPTTKEVLFWEKVFDTWGKINGRETPKTKRQIIKWLQSPGTDSAEYKAYGNSVCVECVFFVLAGIVWAMEREEDTQS